MERPIIKNIQTPIEGLTAYHELFAKVLAEKGLTATQLNAVFASHIVACCPMCGFSLTAEEIQRFLSNTAQEEPPTSKYGRLRLGYCGRHGCNSRYYGFKFTDYPGVDWNDVSQQCIALFEAPPPEPEIPAPVSRFKSFPPKLILRALLGVAVLLSLLLIRHVMSGGRIPLLQKAHTYQIDPASVGTGK